ncbi:general transcription factor 3C polypeptide 5 [Galendromus occidentalis]|uniref:General transcription factor 3C polypeptide 5 n=1 Tax=Galendromus occidentalis TaxID=34638 RepID=A0AAJ6QV66_9ACAR|nr:general transcription factor 3C polypeptide 5 [Galendromus occidentalis]
MEEYLVIKHPCFVRNGSEEKAMKMLGGLKQVEHTFNMDNMRMQLNFRTEGDCCSKGVFGSHKDVIAFWVSVKKYRNKRTGEIVCRSEVLGSVRHVYEFEGMTDFQFLPAQEGKDIRDKIRYQGVDEDIQTFVNTPADHLYLVPQVFTRLDTPFTGPYRHTSDIRARRTDETGKPVLRRSRTIFATLVRVLAPPNGDPTPAMAQAGAIEQLRSVDKDLRKLVEDAFERRPIWTKSALANELKVNRSVLKIAIVGCAYCVSQGPYRLCYIRYGFDPRKEPSAKIYQTLDCRVKACTGVQKSAASHVVPAQIAPSNSKSSTSSKRKKESDEEARVLRCRFVSGKLPPTRQLLYHLCDIQMDSVQQIVHKNDGNETWTDTDGWCESGSMVHIRDFLTADMKNTAEKLRLKLVDDIEMAQGEATFDEEIDDMEEADETIEDEMDVD